MKNLSKEITVGKEDKRTIDVKQYENLDELLTNESAATILEYFNLRYGQVQAMEQKKSLKPRKFPIKEKRNLAFRLFSKNELKKCTGEPELFEDMLKEKLILINKQIEDKEIV